MNQPLDLVPEPPVLPEQVVWVCMFGDEAVATRMNTPGEPAMGSTWVPFYARPERTTEAMATPQPPEVVSKQAPETAGLWLKWTAHLGWEQTSSDDPQAVHYVQATPQQAPEPERQWSAGIRALMEKPAESGAERPSEAMAVLRELVACKDLKERVKTLEDDDGYSFAKWQDLLADYQYRQPLAWAAARALVSTPAPETKP